MKYFINKVSTLREGGIRLTPGRGELALLPMGQGLLATRSLRSLDIHRLFALPTMAKQKGLPFGEKLPCRILSRSDDSFLPASRGEERVCVRLCGSVAKYYCPYVVYLLGNIDLNHCV